MKSLLILCIVLCFLYLAFNYLLLFRKKRQIYEDLIKFCNTYILEVKFNKDNISKIVSKHIEQFRWEFKREIQKFLSQKQVYFENLSMEENSAINSFFSSLGKSDVEGEILNIENYKLIFLEKLKEKSEDFKNKGILGAKLIVVVGLMVSIILI